MEMTKTRGSAAHKALSILMALVLALGLAPLPRQQAWADGELAVSISPTTISATDGGKVTLTATATGGVSADGYTFAWKYDMSNGYQSSFNSLCDGTDITTEGATSTLEFTASKTTYEGAKAYCIVTNGSNGSVTSEKIDITFAQGETYKLKCEAVEGDMFMYLGNDELEVFPADVPAGAEVSVEYYAPAGKVPDGLTITKDGGGSQDYALYGSTFTSDSGRIAQMYTFNMPEDGVTVTPKCKDAGSSEPATNPTLTLVVDPAAAKQYVSLATTQDGTLTLSEDNTVSIAAGTEVEVRFSTYGTNYEPEAVTVTGATIKTYGGTGWYFEMPETDATCTVTLSGGTDPTPAKYAINSEKDAGIYSVSFKEHTGEGIYDYTTVTEAAEGAEIAIYPVPDDDFELDTVTVVNDTTKETFTPTLGANDYNGGKYYFTMPASTVTVKVTSKAAEVPAETYSWSIGEYDDEVTLSAEEGKFELGKPFEISITAGDFVFDELSFAPDWEDDVTFELSDDKKTATITVGADWNDNSNQDDSLTITPSFTATTPDEPAADVEIAVPKGASLTYNGKTQEGVAAGTGYTVKSGGTGKDAGSYTAQLEAAEGYVFATGEKTAKVTWTIARAKVKAPTAVKNLVYTGRKLTGVKAAANAGYTVKGNTGVNAGTYKAKAVLDKNHVWANGTAGAISLKWTIAKAANKVTAAKAKVSASFKAKKLKKKAQSVALPKLSAKAGKASWAVQTADKKKVLSLNAKTGKVQVKKKAKKGTYTIKLQGKAAASANYKAAASGTVTVTVKVK